MVIIDRVVMIISAAPGHAEGGIEIGRGIEIVEDLLAFQRTFALDLQHPMLRVYAFIRARTRSREERERERERERASERASERARERLGMILDNEGSRDVSLSFSRTHCHYRTLEHARPLT
jgi:hypothetical protein